MQPAPPTGGLGRETAAGPPPAVAPAGSNTTAWLVAIVGTVLVLFAIPLTFTGLGGLGGTGFLVVPALLVGLVVLVARLQGRNAFVESPPGLPAPFGGSLYGLPRQSGRLRDRMRAVPPGRRSAHVGVLWSLVALVAAAGIGVLAAIVAGPRGEQAATTGLVLLLGWGLTLAAYFAGGFRALLPAALGLMVHGLVLHVSAVVRAWDVPVHWNESVLLLWPAAALLQAFAAEAAFRPRGGFWLAWAVLGTAAAAALPVYGFLAGNGPTQNWFVGATVASLAWGAAALFAFAAVPRPLRAVGVAVMGAWALSIAVALGTGNPLAQRLQAAGMVSSAIVAAVAVTTYFVLRPRAKAA